MSLARLSIKRPVTVLMGMFIVILLGVVSYLNIQLDLLPNITPPVADIITQFKGASAQEVADLVTIPLESVAATTPGIKDLMSVSQEGLSIVVATFDWGHDMSQAREDIAQKVGLVPLPEGASKPSIMKFDPTLLPIMQLSVTESKDRGLAELTDLARNTIKPRLEGVEGVASVDILGGLTRQVIVSLDPKKLSQYGLTQDGVAAVIGASNLNYPLGSVQKDDLIVDLRLSGKFKSVDDIKNLVVGYAPSLSTAPTSARQGGKALSATSMPATGASLIPIRLSDIATVKEDYAEVTAITRLNGKPSVNLLIQKEGNGNTVSVARAVRKELDKISDELGGLEVEVPMDQSWFIEKTIKAVANNLLIGAGLAILVLILFLKDVRTTFVISVSIPFSVIATFVLMYFGNLTLNIMTLGGLALGVGMLVDNSIVVIESIYRHIEEGEDPKTAAANGTGEVAMAITASTLTTVVVFLPVVFVGGISGILFKELAWTVTFSLAASLLVALTIVPMIASRWLAQKKRLHGKPVLRFDQEETSRFETRNSTYSRLLKWSLTHRALVIAIVIALAAGSAYLATKIDTEFLPTADEGSFSVDIGVKEGTPLQKIDEVVSEIEKILESEKSVASYSVSVGRSEGLTGARSILTGAGASDARILVKVKDDVAKRKETRRVMDDVEEQVKKIKGDARVTFNLQSSVMALTNATSGSIEVLVSGPDIAEVSRLSDTLIDRMEKIDGMKYVRSSLTARKPEVHVIVNQEKAIANGITPAEIARVISSAVRGQTVTRYESGSSSIDIVVRYDKDSVKDAEAIRSISLNGRTGKVTLKDIADVIDSEGPLLVYREDQRLSARVTGQFTGRNLGSVSSDVSKIIEEMDIPSGYRVTVGGLSEIMQEAFDSLKLAFALAAALIYMVMAASFESLKMPFLIMFTMPLAAIGVILALYLSGYAFGVTAFMGVIVLAGVVVNNGIVMVDFINQRRSAGMPAFEAIVDGAAKRVRPVLMTSLTTILGLVPMALGLGEGGELEAPMALAIMGGLTTGTFLTLIVIPVVYSIFEGVRPEKVRVKHEVPVGITPEGIPALANFQGERATESEPKVTPPGTHAGEFTPDDMEKLIELLGKLFTTVKKK